MKLLFIINTSAQAHTWKNVIQQLILKGQEIKIVARDYGSTLKLLKSFNLPYSAFKPQGSRYFRFLLVLDHFQNCYKLSKDFNPSIIIGFGLDAAVTAARLKTRCITFIDDDPTFFQNYLTRLLANAVITPECFTTNLGKKQIKVKGYKEFAYLHPNYFKPDPTIFDELKINKDEKYIILRFNVFDAIHDIGRSGFTVNDQFELVKTLGKYARIFISPEQPLPKELEPYRLPTALNRIHHVLYYAQMLISDTGTMTTEAAILGTPSILCLSNANKFGNFIELSQKYDLIYCYNDSKQAIQKAADLIKQPDLKERWSQKRKTLLNDKIDVTKFMVDYIEKFDPI